MAQLTFSWEEFHDCLTPNCLSSEPALCLLAYLLLDDGGLSRTTSLEWLNVGLEKTTAVIDGDLASFEWGREAWSATIQPGSVTIYSLHDETCRSQIDPERFHSAMSAWIDFVASAPSAGSTVTVSI